MAGGDTIASCGSQTRFRPLTDNQSLEFYGLKLVKSGEQWGVGDSVVSPDQTWIVLQSYSGPGDQSPKPGFTNTCPVFGCRGQVFFDVFNLDTGKKTVTIQGAYNAKTTQRTFFVNRLVDRTLIHRAAWGTPGALHGV